MILVEFLSETPIDNLLAVLLLKPEEVFYVSDDMALTNQWHKNLERAMKYIPYKPKIHFLNITFRQYAIGQKELETFLTTHDNCYFDVFGGDETILLTLGMLYERYQTQGHHLVRADLPSGRVLDLATGLDLTVAAPVPLSLDAYMCLSGGCIFKKEHMHSHIFEDPAIRKNILQLWEGVQSHLTAWNHLAGKICSNNPGQFHRQFDEGLAILKDLGFLRSTKLDKQYQMQVSADPAKRKVLHMAIEKYGDILEMTMAALLYDTMTSITSVPIVCQGVNLDWDGVIPTSASESNVENEIDVMTIYRYYPVFISCKLGSVPEDEYYKLKTVADNFGGSYAIKILVIGGYLSPSYIQRCQEFGIHVISNIVDDQCSLSELQRRLSTILNHYV